MDALFNNPMGPNPTNVPFTLKMLEEQLARARSKGAPDDARILRGAGWAYIEVQWIGEG